MKDHQPFSQSAAYYLFKGLGISKDGAELLESRQEIKLCSHLEVHSSDAGPREVIRSVFPKERYIVICNELQGPIKCFYIQYDPSEWRLFIDLSKTSFKLPLHMHRSL